MGPKTKKLINTLEELINLLKQDKEEHWLKWIKQSKEMIESSDYSGVEKLLQAYGGMGSFNDLVLGVKKKEGALSQSPEGEELNENLQHLRSKVWQLANEIKKEQ